MVKLIIFDFDGVIEDTYELHYELSSKKFSNLTREEHRELFDGNVYLGVEKLRHRDTGFDRRRYFSGAKSGAVTTKDVKTALKILSENYDLGIITSAIELPINDYLKSNGLFDLFSFVYGFETGKSKVHKFEKVLEKFKLGKNDCLFVTDTLGDILEANKVGIKTIAVDFGFHEKERLAKGNPSKIISDINELVPVIRELS